MIVIKYGGHALPEPGVIDSSLSLIADEFKRGEKIVLVHGGGPQINRELALHNLKIEMANGIRKTTPEVLAVVQKVLSGEVLRNIVNQLIGLGINAVGISSGDGGLIRAEPKIGDLGLVGDIKEVNKKILMELITNGYLPVISPIGVTNSGAALNLNADLVAGEIGGALGSKKVLFMTDVKGIYRNWPDENSVIPEISAGDLSGMISTFSEGMVPKVESVLIAIAKGAKSAYVFDGRDWRNLEKAIHGDIGTKVCA
jgi:acetylglutamate kinase